MQKVAVIGSGAIGCAIGAWLIQRDDLDVVFCVRTPFEILSVDTPRGRITAGPRLLLRPEDVDTDVDWVLVVTKTYDAVAAQAWLSRLARENTRVAVLQNGVEHRDRFPAVHSSQLLPVIVDLPAQRSAPGRVLQRRDGCLTVPTGKLAASFAAMFAQSPIAVIETDDWDGAAWRKLAVNCAGAINALTLMPEGISRDPRAAAIMREMVLECLAVGRAEGIELPDRIADEVIEGYRAADPDSVNSIHADRLAERRTEADARNGVISRLGAKHGIATPLNRMADAVLQLGHHRAEYRTC